MNSGPQIFPGSRIQLMLTWVQMLVTITLPIPALHSHTANWSIDEPTNRILVRFLHTLLSKVEESLAILQIWAIGSRREGPH
jgi:hypothetical protein